MLERRLSASRAFLRRASADLAQIPSGEAAVDSAVDVAFDLAADSAEFCEAWAERDCFRLCFNRQRGSGIRAVTRLLQCGLGPLPNPFAARPGPEEIASHTLYCGERVEKRSYRECAGEKVPSISSECVGLRETYFNCKRGQVDMRARIRGNKGY